MIRFERFEKSFGTIRAVRPLDLEVSVGESFALLGPNGGGKTSIIRAVVGLHAPSGGRILVDGLDVSEERCRVQERFLYVPQRVSVPDLLTVHEVLWTFARLNRVSNDRIDRVLELFELGQFRDRPSQELSGGTLQRLGLAIAFLREAPLVVMDEPTLNLDPLGVEVLQDLLRELKEKGTTIFFSTHLLHNAIQLADRVGILVGGRMVAIEQVSTFKASVTQRTVVRLQLSGGIDPGLATEVAERAGAGRTECSGSQICFTALPEHRLDVIRALEKVGGVIEAFHTEDPDWESLIRDHFGANGEGKE